MSMIEELVGQAATHAGLNEDQARTALSAALHLIRKHADSAMVETLFREISGSSELADAGAALTPAKSGLMAGLLRGAGGSGGEAMSDAMAMNQQLTRQGITISDMQKILPLAMNWVQQKTGRDLLRETLSTIPGLGSLLTGAA
jgi:Flp pilus assembly CpaF family ATPase